MDWGVVIVAVVALVGSVLTQLGVGTRVKHEREMRILEERMRATREIAGHIAAVDSLIAERSQRKFGRERSLSEPTVTEQIRRYTAQATSLAWQLDDSALIDAVRRFEIAATLLYAAELLEKESDEINDVSARYKQEHKRVAGEIGRISEIAAREQKAWWRRF